MRPITKVPPQKLLADLLKRQARSVMGDITECPPDTLPAHVSRLRDLASVIEHAIYHELVEPAEGRPSGKQLMHPCTLGDFAECLRQTKQMHRAPAWVNDRDETLAAINRKLDLIGGHLSGYGQNFQRWECPACGHVVTEGGAE